jgi:hypothetical protein
LPPDTNLREELDIDSMDFLNVVVALREELGVEIPKRTIRSWVPSTGRSATSKPGAAQPFRDRSGEIRKVRPEIVCPMKILSEMW